MSFKLVGNPFRCVCGRVALKAYLQTSSLHSSTPLLWRIPTNFLSKADHHASFIRHVSTHHDGSNIQTLYRERSIIDPYQLVSKELKTICIDIKQELKTNVDLLKEISHYHFDGNGKAFRPMIILLLAKALNLHQSTESDGEILSDQKKIAQIAEMIHVASLMHDDVIDASETRRGKSSVHFKWGQLNAILVGDFILSKASKALAKLKNIEVIVVLAQVIEDLVKGEFMQLGSKEDEDQRFAHYLQKTYKKTASLIANSCKAVAILSGADEEDSQLAYLYGRHVGIAFQLIDDLLDFISNTELMGKPTAADLKLGLATGPVLFAAQKFPDLNTLIMRRFKEEGDVDQAWNYVKQSDGIQQTRLLAENHCCQAINQIKQLKPSMAREALISITHMVLDRKK